MSLGFLLLHTTGYGLRPEHRRETGWCYACGDVRDHECGRVEARHRLWGLIPTGREEVYPYRRCIECGLMADAAQIETDEASGAFVGARRDAIERASAGTLEAREKAYELGLIANRFENPAGMAMGHVHPDWVSSLASVLLMAMIYGTVAMLAVVVAISVWGSPGKPIGQSGWFVAWAAMFCGGVFIVLPAFIAARATMKWRFRRKHFDPQLVRAVARLDPSLEDLESLMEYCIEEGRALAWLVDAPRLHRKIARCRARRA